MDRIAAVSFRLRRALKRVLPPPVLNLTRFMKAAFSSMISKRLVDRIRLRSLEKRKVAHKHDWDGYRRVLDEFTPSAVPHKIYLNQIWPEWKQFVEFLVRERSPERILEIGTGRAGSTYFLTKVGGEGSLLVTVDTKPIAKEFVDLYKRSPKQRIINLIGNSRDPITWKGWQAS